MLLNARANILLLVLFFLCPMLAEGAEDLLEKGMNRVLEDSNLDSQGANADRAKQTVRDLLKNKKFNSQPYKSKPKTGHWNNLLERNRQQQQALQKKRDEATSFCRRILQENLAFSTQESCDKTITSTLRELKKDQKFERYAKLARRIYKITGGRIFTYHLSLWKVANVHNKIGDFSNALKFYRLASDDMDSDSEYWTKLNYDIFYTQLRLDSYEQALDTLHLLDRRIDIEKYIDESRLERHFQTLYEQLSRTGPMDKRMYYLAERGQDADVINQQWDTVTNAGVDLNTPISEWRLSRNRWPSDDASLLAIAAESNNSVFLKILLEKKFFNAQDVTKLIEAADIDMKLDTLMLLVNGTQAYENLIELAQRQRSFFLLDQLPENYLSLPRALLIKSKISIQIVNSSLRYSDSLFYGIIIACLALAFYLAPLPLLGALLSPLAIIISSILSIKLLAAVSGGIDKSYVHTLTISIITMATGIFIFLTRRLAVKWEARSLAKFKQQMAAEKDKNQRQQEEIRNNRSPAEVQADNNQKKLNKLEKKLELSKRKTYSTKYQEHASQEDKQRTTKKIAELEREIKLLMQN